MNKIYRNWTKKMYLVVAISVIIGIGIAVGSIAWLKMKNQDKTSAKNSTDVMVESDSQQGNRDT